MSDKTLEHAAVKAYRDQFKLNVKLGFREDIIITVTDLDLWKSILANWGYWKEGKWIKYSPLNIKGMISEYERRTANERTAKQSNRSLRRDEQHGEPRPHVQNVSVGLPERRDSRMSVLRQRERPDARTGGQTLDDILAQAMQRLSKTG